MDFFLTNIQLHLPVFVLIRGNRNTKYLFNIRNIYLISMPVTQNITAITLKLDYVFMVF